MAVAIACCFVGPFVYVGVRMLAFIAKAGEYGVKCSSLSGAVCGACAVGTYKTEGVADSTFAAGCTVCAACPSGTYRSGCGGAQAGTCVDCLAETYKIEGEDGTYTTTCSACDPTACAGGEYLDGCGAGNAGTCQACSGCPVVLAFCYGV